MEQTCVHGRVLDVVNEENFDLFVQAHNAALSGDFETSNAIRTELGLNNGKCPAHDTNNHNMRGKGQGRINVQSRFVYSNSDDLCNNYGNRKNIKCRERF